MTLYVNGTPVKVTAESSGLEIRPITKADYDVLSSSDKNLDILYLVDNSVTRMTKTREAEFEWFAPRVENNASNTYITMFPPISFSSEDPVDVSKLFRNGSLILNGATIYVSFGPRTAFRALRITANYAANVPATIEVCFSDDNENWSDSVILYPETSPEGTEIFSSDYYLPNDEVQISRYMKITFSKEGNGANSSQVNLLSLLISPRQDSEGSSGESYSRYVLYYHDTPLWRNEETIGEGMDFSTEEKVVGRWIDGKPLYQRTFETTLIDAPFDAKSVLMDIGGSEVQPIYYWTTVKTKSGEVYNVTSSNVNFSENNYLMFRLHYFDENGWVIQGWVGNNGYSGSALWVSVLYVKTTDAPVDALIMPSSESSVVIDDQERVIGTYFGATMYERTFITTLPTSALPWGKVMEFPSEIADVADCRTAVKGSQPTYDYWTFGNIFERTSQSYACQFNVARASDGSMQLSGNVTDPIYFGATVYATLRYTKKASL